MSDVRALGSIYGQSAFLPYVSGHAVEAGTSSNFPNGRAVYVNATGDNQQLVCQFADQASSFITLSGFVSANSPEILPLALVSISGTSTVDATVLY